MVALTARKEELQQGCGGAEAELAGAQSELAQTTTENATLHAELDDIRSAIEAMTLEQEDQAADFRTGTVAHTKARNRATGYLW